MVLRVPFEIKKKNDSMDGQWTAAQQQTTKITKERKERKKTKQKTNDKKKKTTRKEESAACEADAAVDCVVAVVSTKADRPQSNCKSAAGIELGKLGKKKPSNNKLLSQSGWKALEAKASIQKTR